MWPGSLACGLTLVLLMPLIAGRVPDPVAALLATGIFAAAAGLLIAASRGSRLAALLFFAALIGAQSATWWLAATQGFDPIFAVLAVLHLGIGLAIAKLFLEPRSRRWLR